MGARNTGRGPRLRRAVAAAGLGLLLAVAGCGQNSAGGGGDTAGGGSGGSGGG